MSRLAEVYDGGKTQLSAADIAKSRGLPGPFVAKVLSALSRAGLVQCVRGPGGGATLARHPSEIRLLDVFRLFERDEVRTLCPFGGGVCGQGEPCPLHHKLLATRNALNSLLTETTFDEFRLAHVARAGGSESRGKPALPLWQRQPERPASRPKKMEARKPRARVRAK
ncbi:MAG: Rrf2 family transcriptional regulator [Phycisphaerales bacterium]|nr:Rrf2 family transcriptional regulator [Phycisphaerales bacterium]